VLADDPGGIGDTGTVHRDPERAELLGRVEGRCDVVLAGDVAGSERNPEVLGGLFAVRRRQIDDHNARAGGHESLGGG